MSSTSFRESATDSSSTDVGAASKSASSSSSASNSLSSPNNSAISSTSGSSKGNSGTNAKSSSNDAGSRSNSSKSNSKSPSSSKSSSKSSSSSTGSSKGSSLASSSSGQKPKKAKSGTGSGGSTGGGSNANGGSSLLGDSSDSHTRSSKNGSRKGGKGGEPSNRIEQTIDDLVQLFTPQKKSLHRHFILTMRKDSPLAHIYRTVEANSDVLDHYSAKLLQEDTKNETITSQLSQHLTSKRKALLKKYQNVVHSSIAPEFHQPITQLSIMSLARRQFGSKPTKSSPLAPFDFQNPTTRSRMPRDESLHEIFTKWDQGVQSPILGTSQLVLKQGYLNESTDRTHDTEITISDIPIDREIEHTMKQVPQQHRDLRRSSISLTKPRSISELQHLLNNKIEKNGNKSMDFDQSDIPTISSSSLSSLPISSPSSTRNVYKKPHLLHQINAPLLPNPTSSTVSTFSASSLAYSNNFLPIQHQYTSQQIHGDGIPKQNSSSSMLSHLSSSTLTSSRISLSHTSHRNIHSSIHPSSTSFHNQFPLNTTPLPPSFQQSTKMKKLTKNELFRNNRLPFSTSTNPHANDNNDTNNSSNRKQPWNKHFTSHLNNDSTTSTSSNTKSQSPNEDFSTQSSTESSSTKKSKKTDDGNANDGDDNFQKSLKSSQTFQLGSRSFKVPQFTLQSASPQQRKVFQHIKTSFKNVLATIKQRHLMLPPLTGVEMGTAEQERTRLKQLQATESNKRQLPYHMELYDDIINVNQTSLLSGSQNNQNTKISSISHPQHTKYVNRILSRLQTIKGSDRALQSLARRIHAIKTRIKTFRLKYTPKFARSSQTAQPLTDTFSTTVPLNNTKHRMKKQLQKVENYFMDVNLALTKTKQQLNDIYAFSSKNKYSRDELKLKVDVISLRSRFKHYTTAFSAHYSAIRNTTKARLRDEELAEKAQNLKLADSKESLFQSLREFEQENQFDEDSMVGMDDHEKQRRKLKKMLNSQQLELTPKMQQYYAQMDLRQSDQRWNALFNNIPSNQRPLLSQKWYRDLLRRMGVKEGQSKAFPYPDELYKQTIRELAHMKVQTEVEKNGMDRLKDSGIHFLHSKPSPTTPLERIKHIFQPFNDIYSKVQNKKLNKLRGTQAESPDTLIAVAARQRLEFNVLDPNSPLPDLPPAYIKYESKKVFKKYIPTLLKWRMLQIKQRLEINADLLSKQTDTGIYSDTRELLTLVSRARSATKLEGLYMISTPQDNVLQAIRVIDRALGFTTLHQYGPFADFTGKQRFSVVGQHCQRLLKHINTIPVNTSLDADLSLYIDLIQHWQPPPGVKWNPEFGRLQKQAKFIRVDLDYPKIKMSVDLYDRMKLYRGERRYMKYLFSTSDNVLSLRSFFTTPPKRLIFQIKLQALHAEDRIIQFYQRRAQERHVEIGQLGYLGVVREKKVFEDKLIDEMFNKIHLHTFEQQTAEAGFRLFQGSEGGSWFRRYRQQKLSISRWLRLKTEEYDQGIAQIELQYQSNPDRFSRVEGAALKLRDSIESIGDLYFYGKNRIRRTRQYVKWISKRMDNNLKDLYRTDHPIWQGKYPPANAQYTFSRSYYQNVDPYVHFISHYWWPSRKYQFKHVVRPFLQYNFNGVLRAFRRGQKLIRSPRYGTKLSDPIVNNPYSLPPTSLPSSISGTFPIHTPSSVFFQHEKEQHTPPSRMAQKRTELQATIQDSWRHFRIERKYQTQRLSLQTNYVKDLTSLHMTSLYSKMINDVHPDISKMSTQTRFINLYPKMHRIQPIGNLTNGNVYNNVLAQRSAWRLQENRRKLQESINLNINKGKGLQDYEGIDDFDEPFGGHGSLRDSIHHASSNSISPSTTPYIPPTSLSPQEAQKLAQSQLQSKTRTKPRSTQSSTSPSQETVQAKLQPSEDLSHFTPYQQFIYKQRALRGKYQEHLVKIDHERKNPSLYREAPKQRSGMQLKDRFKDSLSGAKKVLFKSRLATTPVVDPVNPGDDIASLDSKYQQMKDNKKQKWQEMDEDEEHDEFGKNLTEKTAYAKWSSQERRKYNFRTNDYNESIANDPLLTLQHPKVDNKLKDQQKLQAKKQLNHRLGLPPITKLRDRPSIPSPELESTTSSSNLPIPPIGLHIPSLSLPGFKTPKFKLRFGKFFLPKLERVQAQQLEHQPRFKTIDELRAYRSEQQNQLLHFINSPTNKLSTTSHNLTSTVDALTLGSKIAGKYDGKDIIVNHKHFIPPSVHVPIHKRVYRRAAIAVKVKAKSIINHPVLRDYELVLEPILHSRNKTKALWRYRRLIFAVSKHATHNYVPFGPKITKQVSKFLKFGPVRLTILAGVGSVRLTGRFLAWIVEKREIKLARHYSPKMRQQYMDSEKQAHIIEQGIRGKLVLQAYGRAAITLMNRSAGVYLARWLVNINNDRIRHRYANYAMRFLKAHDQEQLPDEPRRGRRKLSELVPGFSWSWAHQDIDQLRASVVTIWGQWKRYWNTSHRHRLRAIRQGRDPVLHNMFVPPHVRLLSALWLTFRGYRVFFVEAIRRMALWALILSIGFYHFHSWMDAKDGGSMGRNIGAATERFLNASVWHIMFSHGLLTVAGPFDSEHDKIEKDLIQTQELLGVMVNSWAQRETYQRKLISKIAKLPDRNKRKGKLKRAWLKFYRWIQLYHPAWAPAKYIEDLIVVPAQMLYDGIFQNKVTVMDYEADDSKLLDQLIGDASPQELWEKKRTSRWTFQKIRHAIDIFRSGDAFFNTARMWDPWVDDPMDPLQVRDWYKQAYDPEIGKSRLYGDQWYIPITWFRELYNALDPGRSITKVRPANRIHARWKRIRYKFRNSNQFEGGYKGYWAHPLALPGINAKGGRSAITSDGAGRPDTSIDHNGTVDSARILERIIAESSRHQLEDLPIWYGLDQPRTQYEAERDMLIELAHKERDIAGDLESYTELMEKVESLTMKLAVMDVMAAHDIVIINGQPYAGIDTLPRRPIYNTGFEAASRGIDDESEFEEDYNKEHLTESSQGGLKTSEVLNLHRDPALRSYLTDLALGRENAHAPRIDPHFMVYDENREFHEMNAEELTENQIFEMTRTGRKMYVPISSGRYFDYVPAFRFQTGSFGYDFMDNAVKRAPFFKPDIPSIPDEQPDDDDFVVERAEHEDENNSQYHRFAKMLKWSLLPVRLQSSRGNYRYPPKWHYVRNAMKELLIRDYPYEEVINHEKVRIKLPDPDEWEKRLTGPNEFFKDDFINIIRQLDKRFWGKDVHPYANLDVLRILFEYSRSRVMNVVTVQDDQFIRIIDDLIYSNYLSPSEHDKQFVSDYNDLWNKLWYRSPALRESMTPDPGDVLDVPHSLPTERIKRLMFTHPAELTDFDIEDGRYLNALVEDYITYIKDKIQKEYRGDISLMQDRQWNFAMGISRIFNTDQINLQLEYLDDIADQFADQVFPTAKQFQLGYEQRPWNLQMVNEVINIGYHNRFHRPRPQIWWDPVVVPLNQNITPSDLGYYGVPEHLIDPEWDPLNGVYFTDIFSKTKQHPFLQPYQSEFNWQVDKLNVDGGSYESFFEELENKKDERDQSDMGDLWRNPMTKDLLLASGKSRFSYDPSWYNSMTGGATHDSIDADEDWTPSGKELFAQRQKAKSHDHLPNIEGWWNPWMPQVGDRFHTTNDGQPKDELQYQLDWSHRDEAIYPFIRDQPYTRTPIRDTQMIDNLNTFLAQRYPSVLNPQLGGVGMMEHAAGSEEDSSSLIMDELDRFSRPEHHPDLEGARMNRMYRDPRWTGESLKRFASEFHTLENPKGQHSDRLKRTNWIHYQTEYTPNWYERLGVDQEYIVDAAFNYYYSSTAFDPLLQNQVPDWSTLDVNKYAMREYMQRSYPDDSSFKEWMEEKFNLKYQWARSNLEEQDLRLYIRILDREWAKNVDKFQEVKTAYEKMYWFGPKDDLLANGLNIDPTLEDWYFNEVCEGKFGKHFLRPYWNNQRLLDYRKKVFYQAHSERDKVLYINEKREQYTDKMKEVEKMIETQYYYLLPEAYTNMMSQRAILTGGAASQHFEHPDISMMPKHWVSLLGISRPLEIDLLESQTEIQKLRTWQESPKLYERIYGRDMWLNNRLIDRWAELYGSVYREQGMTDETVGLIAKAKAQCNVDLLPKLPITHDVLIRDANTGQLKVNDHDQDIFELFGTHVYMQNKMDLHWAREHVRDVWADVFKRAMADINIPEKWDLDEHDFKWKNRGMELAVLDLYIQELQQRLDDIRLAIDDNQEAIASLIDETQTLVDAAHIDEVIRNYEEEAAGLSKLLNPIENALSIYKTQSRLYDPINLALYQRYLLQMKRDESWDKLNEEYMDFQNYLQVHWHRLPHPVGGYAQLPKPQDDFLPIFGASQLPPLSTPDNLQTQLDEYLYSGKPFLLAYNDLSPGVISTMEPRFVFDTVHEKWTVEIPVGFDFVNNELSLIIDRARVAQDLNRTLQLMSQHGNLLSLNQFRARGKIVMRRRRENFEKKYSKTNGITFAAQKRPPFFHEEHYDKSVRHERMINAMDWYDTHYFETLSHLELADSGKKYLVAPPGRPWGRVKDRLRRYWRQNYPHFAFMYWKNFSLSRVPGEILFYLEEYYRLQNFDRGLFSGKPLQYKPLVTDYDIQTLRQIDRHQEVGRAVAHEKRKDDVSVIKDMLMDEIANFPDIVINAQTRPLYTTPLLSFEGDSEQYVMDQGTNVALKPHIRSAQEYQKKFEDTVFAPFRRNLDQQQFLIPERDFTARKEIPDEAARRRNFYDNLKILHNIETPYLHYEHPERAGIDKVSAVNEPWNLESF